MADGQAVNIFASRHARHPRGVALALASALLLGGHAAAQQPATTSSFPRSVGPSFDCGSAAAQREPLAQMICTDPGLARLDLTYVQAYQALRHQVGEPNQRDLRREATDFHAAVLARCGVPSPPPAGRPGSAPPPVPQWSPGAARSCIAGLYRAQRQAWLERLVPAAREEAERPLERHIEVQGLLVELGFLPPSTKVDGNYGPATRGAVAGWQRTRGVEPTGFVSDTDALLLERAVQQARIGAQVEMRAREESERLQRAQAERQEAEGRARIAAEARAREEAERQRRAEAEREEAVARLAAAIGGGADEAAVVVTLGREGSRVRRNLRGELVAMDASRPPSACSILGAQTPVAFADFARERFAGLLAGSGQAFRSPCPFGDDALRQDVLLLHDLGVSRATAPTLTAIARALAEGRAEVVGRVSLSEHRADDERRRREAADEAARLAALSDDIRRDALAGQLADWAAVVLARRPATVACVVGPPGGDWAEALRSVLPADAAGALQAAVADTDADRQFARLLSGECGMLVARGRDFGDVLRGVAANKREATVLPMRAPAAAVERALQARPEEQHKPFAARQAVATPPPASPSPAQGLSGPVREEFVRSATDSCVASGGAQGGAAPAFNRTDALMRTYCGCLANGLADEMSVADILVLGMVLEGREQGGGMSALVSPGETQRLRDRTVRVAAACLARPTGGR